MTSISKCDKSLPESPVGITDQTEASTKGGIITLHQDICHFTKSQYFLKALQEEMVNEVLEPGVPGKRITNGFGIVLQQQDFWTLRTVNG